MRMKPNLMEFFQEIIYRKKIRDGAYVIDLDEYADVGTHWIPFYFVTEVKLFISIVKVLNMLLKKLKNLSGTKI